MSSRVLGYSILLVVIAAFCVPMIAPTQQTSDNPAPLTKWEYKVITLESSTCTENQISTSLNSQGQQGWELVGYERLAPAFPKEAQGSLIIAPAATHTATSPATADSFQGAITMRMGLSTPGGCQMVLKRQARRPAAD